MIKKTCKWIGILIIAVLSTFSSCKKPIDPEETEKFPPSEPTNLTVSQPSTSKVVLSWSGDAESYELTLEPINGQALETIALTEKTYTVENIPNEVYAWKVRAKKGNLFSEYVKGYNFELGDQEATITFDGRTWKATNLVARLYYNNTFERDEIDIYAEEIKDGYATLHIFSIPFIERVITTQDAGDFQVLYFKDTNYIIENNFMMSDWWALPTPQGMISDGKINLYNANPQTLRFSCSITNLDMYDYIQSQTNGSPYDADKVVMDAQLKNILLKDDRKKDKK